MNCSCPDDGILEEISSETCPFDMKQIQKVAFATAGKVIWDSAIGDGTSLLGVPQVDSEVQLLADWQARRVAVDNTKIVVTPLIGGDPAIEGGEPIIEGGGDNTTLNGVEEVTGVNPSKFTATFKSLSAAQERSLKAVSCKNTEVYFFLEGGKIACFNIDGGKTQRGFTMQSYFFSDRTNEGYGTKDKFTMSFSLPAGWSEFMTLVTPTDFNPLYDI